MKIAILYICTGAYTVFWPEFFSSCEEFFFPHDEKKYFIFTDGLQEVSAPNIQRIRQECMGWPYDTLKRFSLFKQIENDLSKFDLIFFCNANVEFIAPIGKEILPRDKEKIIVVEHPYYTHRNRETFPYENNVDSLAFIPRNLGNYYICGGFNGGYSTAYLKMINILEKNISIDHDKGIIAVWHDESHINRYIIDHPHILLPAGFCSPQLEPAPQPLFVRIRDKLLYGGHAKLRGQVEPLPKKIKNTVKYTLARAGILPIIYKIRKRWK